MRLPYLVLATLAVTAVGCGDGGDAEPSGPTIAPDAAAIVDASAAAMGDVTSVRFELDRTGEPVYIDSADAIALNSIEGRFEVPESADAVVEVVVAGALTTELGAVAVAGDVWLSNPITGELEPLPPGIDLDPSEFFDPAGGWQPLLENLSEVELIGTEDDDYHLRGIAPAERVEVITVGLVSGIDVVVDLWIDPVTGLVSRVVFTTDLGDGDTNWTLILSDYGETFDITPPPDS
ncbi:MAG: LppX_LprAFG lipoprotein [Acidimicrobiia bacterium]|nr:LppX_LprAFG lipoprotein [Acidimicrobiia bacterium]